MGIPVTTTTLPLSGAKSESWMLISAMIDYGTGPVLVLQSYVHVPHPELMFAAVLSVHQL